MKKSVCASEEASIPERFNVGPGEATTIVHAGRRQVHTAHCFSMEFTTVASSQYPVFDITTTQLNNEPICARSR